MPTTVPRRPARLLAILALFTGLLLPATPALASEAELVIPDLASQTFLGLPGNQLLMLGLGVWSLVCRMRGRLYESRWLHRAAVLMAPAGFAAVLAGWITTEVGRQPYTVYGLLRTEESVSPVNAPAVGASLTAFIIAYFVVFGLGVFYALRLMLKTPKADEPRAEPEAPAGMPLAAEFGAPRSRETAREEAP